MCYTSKNVKNSYKISAPSWNDKFELPDGWYSVSDIPDYFEYIIKKHETFTDNPLIKIYVNIKENRITFKIKRGYYLKLLISKTIKWNYLKAPKKKKTKN